MIEPVNDISKIIEGKPYMMIRYHGWYKIDSIIGEINDKITEIINK